MNDKITILVKKSIMGDQEALDALITYKMKDIRCLSLYFSNYDDYEDIMQDVLYYIVRDIKNLREPKNFDYWLMGIIRNTSRNFFRKSKRISKGTTDAYGEEIEDMVIEGNVDFLPSKYIKRKDSHYAVLQELESLPEHYRKAILYKYYDGLSYSEIAEKMGVKEKDVSNYLTRGRHSLKIHLQKKYKSPTILRNILLSIFVAITTIFKEMGEKVEAFFTNDVTIKHATNKLNSFFSNLTSSKTTFTENLYRNVDTVGNMVMGIVVVGSMVASNTFIPTTTITTNEVPNQDIVTVADMIGKENADILNTYVGSVTDVAVIHQFLDSIGVIQNGNANEYNHIYHRYYLYNQDKQLIIALRINKDTNTANLNYDFGDKTKLPDMYEIIVMFDN